MSDEYSSNLIRNQAFIAPGLHDYNTELNGIEERAFRQWIVENKVPFNPNVAVSDYDMRGFWRSLMNNDPRATTGVDPNDRRLHYPDTWKTPLHETFSAESIFANPKTAPRWNDKDQLVAPDGDILFDDRKPRGR